MVSEADSETREVMLVRLNAFVRRFQQASGFGLRSYGSGVSEALKNHVLVEICTSDQLTVDSLKNAVNVAQSSASRAVKQLQEEGLVKVSAHQNDGRVSVLHATPAGKRLFESINAQGTAMFHLMLQPLTSNQRTRLLSLQSVFADALGAYPSRFSEQVHPMRKNTFRITRGLKLLRTNLFREYHLSTLGWHFLALIEQTDAPLVAKDLCEQFGAATNTVATVIKDLERQKYISRVAAKEDRRRQLLALTAKGRKMLTIITDRQIADLRTSLASMSTEDLVTLTELSERLAMGQAVSPTEVVVSPRVAVRELTTADEIDQGRRLLMRLWLSDPARGSIPEQILAVSNRCFGLFRGDLLQGVCEFKKRAKGFELIHEGFDGSEGGVVLRDECIAICKRLLAA